MSKTTAQLTEELEIATSSLAAAQAEIQEIREAAQKLIKKSKDKQKRLSDTIQEERDKIYESAKSNYTEAIRIAREIRNDLTSQASDSLGLVAKATKEETLHVLKTVFGDDL